MKNLTEKWIKELAAEALRSPPGMGDPYLKDYFESWAPYLRFLYLAVREFKPELAVELGVYLGTATGHMASANSGSPVSADSIKLINKNY